MRTLVTGLSGTVGAALRRALLARGDQVAAYARGDGPVDQVDAVRQQLDVAAPDVVFHLATASRPTGLDREGWRVNVEWTVRLAEACAARRVRLIFTSTVLVFTNDARGPFTPQSPPDAVEGYGGEKRIAETRVREVLPDAVVARLGWQIGAAPGGNQMLSFLEDRMRENGAVGASTRWLPACSFLDDTAAALVQLASAPGGLYLLDSNVRWSFYEIATALSRRAGDAWRIEPTEDFVLDQRMHDPRAGMPGLDARLAGLRAEM
jgi:dTDP-4-dehydrorhamnose reductase